MCHMSQNHDEAKIDEAQSDTGVQRHNPTAPQAGRICDHHALPQSGDDLEWISNLASYQGS